MLATAVLAATFCTTASAADTYQLDPDHTYPSFATDHFGGLSIWRGKFTKSSGTVVLDEAAQTGTLSVTIDVTSIDTGNEKLNQWVRKPGFFDMTKYPTATYQGTRIRFENGKPAEVIGTFTMNGITKPLNLHIESFKCIQHPLLKREVCGTEATATLDRSDYGVDWGKSYGFDMKTTLQIQAEGIKQ
ncbi:YceI family protein [Burkholderia sp. 3C]